MEKKIAKELLKIAKLISADSDVEDIFAVQQGVGKLLVKVKKMKFDKQEEAMKALHEINRILLNAMN